MNKKELKQLMLETLEPRGFMNAKDAYFRRVGEVFLIFELDKSRFSGSFHIDLGIYVDESGDLVQPPPLHKCHFYTHLTCIVPHDPRQELCKAKNFEIAMPKEDRCRIIRECIETYGLPFLESISSIEKIMARLQSPDRGGEFMPNIFLYNLLERRTGWKPDFLKTASVDQASPAESNKKRP